MRPRLGTGGSVTGRPPHGGQFPVDDLLGLTKGVRGAHVEPLARGPHRTHRMPCRHSVEEEPRHVVALPGRDHAEDTVVEDVDAGQDQVLL